MIGMPENQICLQTGKLGERVALCCVRVLIYLAKPRMGSAPDLGLGFRRNLKITLHLRPQPQPAEYQHFSSLPVVHSQCRAWHPHIGITMEGR